MGLLEKATALRDGKKENVSLKPPEKKGLFARAEAMRQEVHSDESVETATNFSGIGKGLLARASAYRQQSQFEGGAVTSTGDLPTDSSKGSGVLSPPLSSRGREREKPADVSPLPFESEQEPKGLLAKASHFRNLLNALNESEVKEEAGVMVERETNESDAIIDNTGPPQKESSWLTETERPRGLLARAQSMKMDEAEAEEEESVFTADTDDSTFEIPDDSQPEEMLYDEETTIDETPVETWEEEEISQPIDAIEASDEDETYDTLSKEGTQDEVASPSDTSYGESDDETSEPGVSQESETLLEYNGNSQEYEDPSMDGHLDRKSLLDETEDGHGDPFEEWEKEAEDSAEGMSRELTGKPEKDKPSGYLIPEKEEELSTRAAEDLIGSRKKIDNYLSLFDITRELSGINDIDEMWQTVLYAVMGQMGVDRIVIFSSEQALRDNVLFYPVAMTGIEISKERTLKPGDEVFEVLSKKSGVHYADEFSKGDLSEQEQLIFKEVDPHVIVPVMSSNRLLAIMMLGSPMTGVDFSMDDLEFVGLLGEMASAGVERVLTSADYEKEAKHMYRRSRIHEKILSFAGRTASMQKLDDLYDLLVSHLENDFGAEQYSLVLLSPADQEYHIFAGKGISPESMEQFALGVDSELIGLISNLTRVYEVPSFRIHPEILRNYTNEDISFMKSYMIVPLINLNWLVGFITIHGVSEPWTSFQRELMVSLSQVASSIFANAVILGEREILFHDPFSPLEKRLHQELKKSADFQTPVSVMEIQIKNIRRLFSLNPADEVVHYLNDVGTLVSDELYETDFMARVGQGRFAVILPGRTEEEAKIFWKKIRSELQGKRMLGSSPVEPSLVANIVTAPDDGYDTMKLLSRLES